MDKRTRRSWCSGKAFANRQRVYRAAALGYVTAMLLRRTFLALALAAFVGLVPRAVPAAATSALVIDTASGPHSFKVELAICGPVDA